MTTWAPFLLLLLLLYGNESVIVTDCKYRILGFDINVIFPTKFDIPVYIFAVFIYNIINKMKKIMVSFVKWS